MMTRAKYLHSSEKTLFVRASFEKKLEIMKSALNKWKIHGREDGDFWPQTISAFVAWENPEDGVYQWKSRSVMSSAGKYKDLVERYWELRKEAQTLTLGRGKEERKRLKATNRILGEQNTRLIWQVMELRDALMRRAPSDPVLSKIQFP